MIRVITKISPTIYFLIGIAILAAAAILALSGHPGASFLLTVYTYLFFLVGLIGYTLETKRGRKAR